MGKPSDEHFQTSGYIEEDVSIYHDATYGAYYHYECGKSFLEVCKEMGLDSSHVPVQIKF